MVSLMSVGARTILALFQNNATAGLRLEAEEPGASGAMV